MRKTEAVAALRAQRRATLEQLAALDDRAWAAPCLGSWRVHDVVAHLVSIDNAALTGRLLPLLRNAQGRADVERWNDEAVGRVASTDPAALLAELERLGGRLAGLADRIPALAWQTPVRTVFGRLPLAFLPARRVFDEWVHGVDIARATERAAPNEVPCPGVLASAVLDALPALSLPRLGAAAGVVRLVVGTATEPDETEHAPRRTWSIDLARRQYGPRVTAPPDATVRLHAAALALLVEGRPVDGYGTVEIEGDGDLAGAVLAGLPPA